MQQSCDSRAQKATIMPEGRCILTSSSATITKRCAVLALVLRMLKHARLGFNALGMDTLGMDICGDTRAMPSIVAGGARRSAAVE